MRLFTTVLIGTLTVFAISAARADDKYLPYWKPSKKAAAKVDFAFRNDGRWHGLPPKFEDFFRYYAGVTVNGRRMIRAEFTHFPNSLRFKSGGDIEFYQTGPAVQITTLDKFPSVSDGGCSVVNMLYDLDADRVVWLRCNGLA